MNSRATRHGATTDDPAVLRAQTGTTMNLPRDTADDVLDLLRPVATFAIGLTDVVDDTFGTEDISDVEMVAILALVADGSISTTELRRRSGLGRRAQDRLVDQLLNSGIIDRARAPDDARVHVLTLTQRGEDAVGALGRRTSDYFTASGDLVAEILSILGGPGDATHDREADESVTSLEVLEQIASLGNELDRAIRAQRAPKHPKDRAQNALVLIAADDRARPSRLAELLHLSPGGLTYVLDGLEADGLIMRRHGQIPGDRRAVVVELTADGREVVAAIGAGLTAVKPDLRVLFTRIGAYTKTSTLA